MQGPLGALSPGRVLAAIVRSGLVDAATACDREVSVVDASRSNPVHVVHLDGTPTFFVKQEGAAVDAGSPLSAEAAAYRWLAQDPALSGIAPPFAMLPGEDDLLVLEVVPGARPMHEAMAALDGDLADVLAELGELLARMHVVRAGSAERGRVLVSVRRPWLLDLPSGAPPDFVAPSEEMLKLIASLREQPAVMEPVRYASDTWRASALIHGDVKWDNVLIRREPGGAWRLWLVDWEMAGWGDPTWDLAAVVEGVVTTQVLATGTLDPAPIAPLVRRVLDAYGRAAGTGLIPSGERLVRLVAARFVQVAIQLAAMAVSEEAMDRAPSTERSGATERFLEIARSFAGEPATWAQRLGVGSA